MLRVYGLGLGFRVRFTVRIIGLALGLGLCG